MGINTKIEWTGTIAPDGTMLPGFTYNPWYGCAKPKLTAAGECLSCYAETLMDTRYGKAKWGPMGTRVLKAEKAWREPLQWNARAEKLGIKFKVFCASLSDFFEGPETCRDPEQYKNIEVGRKRTFELIEKTPNLIWQLLTKRPENVLKFVPDHWLERPVVHTHFDHKRAKPEVTEAFSKLVHLAYKSHTGHDFGFPDNVWIGTSAGTQKSADVLIPALLEIPAKVRFVSCEPLLEKIDLRKYMCEHYLHETGPESNMFYCKICQASDQNHDLYINQIDWVICGGESGPNARPMLLDWARDLKKQCEVTKTPYFFKQNGAWEEAKYKRPGKNGFEYDGKKIHFFDYDGKPADGLTGRVVPMVRVPGKGSNLLDGQLFQQLPDTTNF